MKKIFIPALIVFLASCGEAKKENESTTEAPKTNIRCDSVETMTVDSVTGAQTFLKTWKCDSVTEVAK